MSIDEKRYKDLLTRAYLRIKELEAGRGQLQNQADDVAIIGVAFRLPGEVKDEDSLWSMLNLEHHVVGDLPEERWAHAYDGITNYKGGYLNGIYDFDNRFFALASEEAAQTDPQQRVLLEISAEAFHHAGIGLNTLSESKTGVFIGAAKNGYNDAPVEEITEYLATGGSAASLAGRISYFYNLHGPSMSLDTTCSSSLTAIVQALYSLKNGDCSLALAGGINLIVSPEGHLGFEKLGVMSPDFTCRTFDQEANGIVRAEGCGVVVLKRLNEALSAGDRILGIIRGAAINHDGTSNGFTAPSQKAQEEVIKTALQKAGILASEVSYVETHGTGTLLGDIIELNTLKNTYGIHHEKNPLLIGSVKANIGHAEFAAGIAGLVKVLACFKQEALPRQMNFSTPTPRFDWTGSGLEVVQGKTWPRSEKKRLAALSSFGITGTNVHLIIEEPPLNPMPTTPIPDWIPLVVSAKSRPALEGYIRILSASIDESTNSKTLYQIACQLHRVNSQFSHRSLLLASNPEELKQRLKKWPDVAGSTEKQVVMKPRVVFVFPGQGTQYPGMAKTMLEKFTVFNTAFTRCRDLILQHAGEDIFLTIEKGDEASFIKTNIHYTLFAYQYAMARLWMSFGFNPAAVMGLSMGELAASAISGWLSLEESIRILTIRTTTLVDAESGGTAMAIIEATLEELTSALGRYENKIEIALYGSPRSFVVSGPTSLVEELVAEFESIDRLARKISTSVATHCHLIEPYMPAMAEKIGAVESFRNHCPQFSTADATWLTCTPDAAYWRRNTRQPVRFSQTIEALAQEGYNIFVEMNPHPSISFNLSELAKSIGQKIVHVASSFRKEDEYEIFLGQLDKLYKIGAEPEWSKLFPQLAPPIEIPLPAWDKTTFKKIFRYRNFQEPENHLVHVPELAPVESPGELLTEPIYCWGHLPQGLLSGQILKIEHLHELKEINQPVIRLVSDIAVLSSSGDLVDAIKQFAALPDSLQKVEWLILCSEGIEGDYRDSQNAFLTGLALVAASEDDRIGVKVLEYKQEETNTELLSREMRMPFDRFTTIILTDRQRQVVSLQPKSLLNQTFSPDPNGIYVVTGGTGGVGLQTALFLAERGVRQLALMSRNNRFGQQGQLHDKNDRNGRFYEELKSKNCTIEHVGADVANAESLATALAHLRTRYGRIAGVIHAAGWFSEGYLNSLTAEEIDRAVAAKTLGARLLHEQTLCDSPAHFILYSSISSLYCTPTLGVYSASNRFLNAFAHWRRKQQLPATAIIWPIWKEAGIAADRGEVADTAFKAITNREVFRILDYALVSGEPILVAGSINKARNFDPVFDQAPFLVPHRGKTTVNIQENDHSPVPISATDTREIIRQVWADFLGNDQIDDDQNFFQLGGNSILATRIVNRLKEHFKGLTLIVADLLRSPSVARLAGLIDGRRQDGMVSSSGITIKPLPKQERYRASNEQRRFWLQSKIDENASFNNLTGTYRLLGPLQIDNLERAFALIVEENEILRTTYQEAEGELYQILHPEASFSFYRHSCKTIDEAKGWLEQHFRLEAAYAYDLSVDFPLRGYVLSVDSDQELNYLLLNLHHIAADGWAMGQFTQKLTHFYSRLLQGETVSPTIPDISYKDYSVWLSEFIHSEAALPHRNYWLDQLAGARNQAYIETDFNRSDTTGHQGYKFRHYFSEELTQQLSELSNRQNCSMFTTLLAAFKILLYKRSGKTDLIVGTIVSGREHPELETQVGNFMNLLPIRTELNENDPFTHAIRQVAQSLLETFEHRIYPFDQIIEDIKFSRVEERNPLFDYLFIFQNHQEADLQLEGLKVERLQSDPEHSKTDILLELRLDGNRLQLNIEYNTGLYRAETMEQLRDDYEQLLQALADQPRVPICTIDSGDENVKSSMVSEFNAPFDRKSYEPAVLEFEQQARITPDKVALVQGPVSISYGQLQDLSWCLAAQIGTFLSEDLSIGHVAIGNQVEQIVAMLALMRAAKIYCPIQPDEMGQSLQHKIIRTSGPVLFLTTTGHYEYLKSTGIIRATDEVVVFSAFDKWDWISKQAVANASTETKALPVLSSQQPAYLVYTSGSTGKPKGIVGRSDALTQFVDWEYQELASAVPLDTVWITRHTFDASFRDLLLPLLKGGKVIIPPLEVQDNLVDLAGWLNPIASDVLHLVPSVFRILASELSRGSIMFKPKAILLAGEKIQTNEARKWQQYFPHTRFYNLYGASETTMIRSFHPINPEYEYGPTIPAGIPIGGTKVAVIKNNRICAPGEVGEVYIKTPFATLGYFNDKILTRKVFVQNPLNPDDDLVYKTGDLGRINRCGLLEIIGRNDQQVKINGVRVELSAIEDAIIRQAGIDQVVVLQSEADQQLTACYTTNQPVDLQVIKQQLALQLAPYQLPVHWIRFERFPLNPHGKIDRRKLSVSTIDNGLKPKFKPSNKKQVILASIWNELTGREPASENERFFEAGGNSLSAMVFIGRIKKAFGVDPGFRAFFTNATIAGIEQLLQQPGISSSGDIPTLGRQVSYAISHAQHRMWVLHHMEENSITYNMKRAFVFDGPVDFRMLEKALLTLVEQHESLRTNFIQNNDTVFQIVHDPQNHRFKLHEVDPGPVDDLQAVLQRIANNEAWHVFDLENESLFRSIYVKTGNASCALLFCLHHIIADGWSLDKLLVQLQTLYNELSVGHIVHPESLLVQYKDFAAWQNQQINGQEIGVHKKYWLDRFSGEIPVLELPTDFPRRKMKSYVGEPIRYRIEAPLTQAIKHYANKENASLFMVLLGAVKVLLFKYSGQTDLVVGSPVAGRNHHQLEELVGFFVNTVALRTQINPEASFESCLQTIVQTTIDAYEHQLYPFDCLVDELNLDRDVSRSPLFDVTVQLLNVATESADTRFSLGQAKAERYFKADWKRSQFDLSFFFREEGDELFCLVEYNSGLFKKERINRMIGHLIEVLGLIATRPDVPVSQLNYIPKEELGQLAQFGEGIKTAPARLVTDLLDQQIEIHPDYPAAKDQQGVLTFGELDQNSSRLARLLTECNPVYSVVAILTRSKNLLIQGMVAIFRSRCIYLPLDVNLPYDRLHFLLTDSKASTILTDTASYPQASKLQQEIEGLTNLVCLDTDNPLEIEEPISDLMTNELWRFVAEQARDEIELGGWKSSFTGLPFSKAEMDEYAGNIFQKLEPYLNSSVKVLEIGCSSGITLFKIAPRVQFYYGTDLSADILKKTGQEVARLGLDNVRLEAIAAHEIESCGDSGFDVIIINSVIQSFSGYNYFHQVIEKVIALAADRAILFLGDLQDLEKKPQMIADLKRFKAKHSRDQYKTKTDWSTELFVSRQLLEDLQADFANISRVDHSEKIAAIENELTRYRFDSILHIDKTCSNGIKLKSKHQFGLSAVGTNKDIDLPSIQENDIAYLIYTSGTTGFPKGVQVAHRSLANFIAAMSRLFGPSIDESKKMMFITPPTFDVSLFELWMGLCSGATLVGFPDQEVTAGHIASFLEEEQITQAYIHPGLLDEVAVIIGKNSGAFCLNKLLVGVEPISAGTLQNYLDVLPGIRIINGYGPTEATICATAFEFKGGDEADEIVAIGRPLDNNTVSLCDRFGQAVGIGVPGQLLIEGAGVSKGYLNQPDLTSQLFVNDRSGRTWYHSGDYACWSEDGQLKFLGRRDMQVKIRGYRVELLEIKHRLHDLFPVVKSEIMVHNDRILCFFCAPEVIPVLEISEELTACLPAYMVPDQILQIDAMPQNRHGKTDRARLLELLSLSVVKDTEQARTKTEIHLLNLFRELLQTNDIGVTHNFFECGGHSIIAIRLVSKAFNQYKYHLKLIDVFTSPTVRELAAKVDVQHHSELPEITSCEKLSHYPLSDAQKRLWIIDRQARSDSEKSSYNMVGAFAMQGEIRLDWFEKALNQVVQKHEILRTRFVEIEGEPFQYIDDSRQLTFIHQIVHTNGTPRDQAIEQMIDQEAGYCFDLTSGELIRCSHFRLIDSKSQESQIVVMVMHHIISDGWSMNVFARDVLNSYSMIAEGGTGELTPLPLQYRDYSQWYNRLVDTHPVFREQEQYWLKELADGIVPINLPIDFNRPANNRMTGRTLWYQFSEESSKQIELFIRQESELTLFMLLSGALALMMSKLSFKNEVLIGTPVTGRISPKLENQIGFYLNNLALRFEIDQEQTVDDYLKKVAHQVLMAFKNQEYPFNQIMASLAEQGIPQGPFNVYLALQNIAQPEFRHNSGKLTALNYERKTSRFDLNFMFDDKNEQLLLQLQYNDCLFAEDTIRAFAQYLENILLSFTRNTQQLLGQIRLEKKEISSKQEGNFIGKKQTIHTIFDLIAQTYAGHVALIKGEKQLRYEELNQRASSVANGLISRGVQTGQIVGLCLSRSVDMVVSILGILKAGAAYLPIDPLYPQQRIDFLLADAGATLVLSDEPDRCFPIDTLYPWQFNIFSTESPQVELPADSLAYIIYTSGSTGKPKGVMITHQNLYSILFENGCYRFTPEDTWTLFHNYTFDFSVWEIFASLLSGGRLVIVDEKTAVDTAAFVRLVQNERVSVLNQTPGAFYNFADQSLEANLSLPDLKMVIFGGDKLNPARLKAWHQAYPLVKLINMYGITETTIHVTYKELGPHDFELPASNIGKPVSSLDVVVLDQGNNPLPDGVPGQLGISGKGLAKGYLNDPELTAKKFVTLPANANQLTYLSGDLCKRLPDGDIEYLGRIDNQVKIRGHRIELGEIEDTLHRHPEVLHSIVLKPEQEEQLVAFVQTRSIFSQLKEPKGENWTRLPNLLAVYHNNQYETDFLYNEIFGSQSYLNECIRPFAEGVIFDVGANIGLYSLHAAMNFPGSAIYAFEPIPETFHILKENATYYQGLNIVPYGFGLSDKEIEVDFTYYPNNSVLSGQQHNVVQDKQLVRQYLQNIYKVSASENDINLLVEERMEARNCRCKLRRLSSVITELGLSSINLLKIDVEKSELEVLLGVDPEHWPIIDQVIMEVYDQDDKLQKIVSLLENQGFKIRLEEEKELSSTGLYNLFAARVNTDGLPYIRFNGKLLSPEALNAALLDHCRQNLPPYMIPNKIVPVWEIPLTSNGKTDRTKLLSLTQPELRRIIEMPAGQTEEKLMEVWNQILNKTTISTSDDFFECGGHSLNATQLASRISRAFKINLSISDVFTHRTIRSQAQFIDKTVRSDKTEIIVPAPERPWYRVSPQQNQLLVSAGIGHHSAKTAYNITGMLKIFGNLDIEAVKETMVQLAGRHEILRTVFRVHEGQYQQFILPVCGPVTWIVPAEDPFDDEYLRQQYHKALEHEFDLQNGPLVRLELHTCLHKAQTLFVLNLHHIICDGFSLTVFNREFRDIYEQLVHHHPVDIQPLEIQYKDFSEWYHHFLDNPERMASYESYWKKRLADFNLKCRIPGSLLTNEPTGFEGALYTHTFNHELLRGLMQQTGGEVTLYSQLMAAVMILVSKYTAQNDIVLGMPVAGRFLPELENQIGFFVNTLPFRQVVDSNQTISELLVQLSENLIKDYEHQIMPLTGMGELVKRSAGYYGNPFFDILVLLQNSGHQDFSLDELRIEAVASQSERSVFSLSFIFEESDHQLNLKVQYNNLIYNSEDVEIIVHYLTSILNLLIHQPDCIIETLDLE